jgi:hypothetical protein
MSISARNIFNYDSLLSKRIQLDNREYQIRQKERDLLGQALMQRNTQPDQQASLIRSQRFFELGFEEGFKRAQAGETEVPDLGGLFSIFAGALIRGNVRAEGGPVKKGEPYVVGEKGPELIVPSESGNVIPNDEYSNLASSINQSVGGNKVKTIVQPVIQNQITQVPTPVPIAQPVGGNVTRMKRSELPNNIAKLIQ